MKEKEEKTEEASKINRPYKMIAVKWRPQKFREMVGQSLVCRSLKNAIELGRIPHAILLVGPRGTGKTSTARIVAKTIQCQNKQEGEPCNKCVSCVEITESRSFDVLEIDGASHTGVETIKEVIRQSIALPVGGPSGKRIYIIDEVHMLSSSAFNALLKTLEEPPEHVLFIMATTEAHKIPQTVLSRCQRFEFHLLPLKDVVTRLQQICHEEGILIEEEVLWLLARQSGGSMRDSQSLLDQLITFSDGKKIHKDLASDLLGLSDRSLLMDFLSLVTSTSKEKQNKGGLVTLVRNILQKALNPKVFVQNLLLLIKNMLIIKMLLSEKSESKAPNETENPEMSAFLDLPDSEIHILSQWAQKCSFSQINRLFNQALELYKNLSQVQQPLLVFEVGLLNMGMEEEASRPTVQTMPKVPAKPTMQAKATTPTATSTAPAMPSASTAPAMPSASTAPAMPSASTAPSMPPTSTAPTMSTASTAPAMPSASTTPSMPPTSTAPAMSTAPATERNPKPETTEAIKVTTEVTQTTKSTQTAETAETTSKKTQTTESKAQKQIALLKDIFDL